MSAARDSVASAGASSHVIDSTAPETAATGYSCASESRSASVVGPLPVSARATTSYRPRRQRESTAPLAGLSVVSG